MASRMGFVQSLLHSDINPANNKSRTLPLLNVKDKYGRTFHLAWIGFFVAFLSWFAFPPLLHGVIQKDLQLTHAQIANSNIIALLATFLVRLIVGPLCDKYGPRYVMIGCLLAGAIPTALTPFITNATGLIVIRFFVGILGGTFVPCQVWTSQFFDKNIIGYANALAAGWGNAGGGVTFFLMPAVVSSLMHNHGLSQYWAWRLAFPICPLVIIIGAMIATLLFGDDTPTGPWSTRHLHANTKVVDDIDITKTLSREKTAEDSRLTDEARIALTTDTADVLKESVELRMLPATDEIQQAPSPLDIWKTVMSLKILLVSLPYLCSFGSELAVEGVISDFYIQTAKNRDGVTWSSQIAGNWASVFGLLNIVTRPLGGYISDIFYQHKGLNAKKWWMIFLGVMQGVFFIWIGFAQFSIYPLLGAMTGLAIFMEAANGAVFALVPAIHPKFNGVVSGVTGGAGNVGGIIFNLVFRFLGKDYHQALWIIGIVCVGSNLVITGISV